MWCPGSVWCLIVSIPDLCLLTYFDCNVTETRLSIYHKQANCKFYRRPSELIVDNNVGLKTLLQHGISDLVFYGD